ncbi:MAG: glycosyltransferase family 4 protein [Candidatus Rifleibacteriota bacterium]
MAQACDRIVNNLRQSGINVDLVHFCPHQNSKVIQQQNGRMFVFPDQDGPGHTLNCLYNLLQAESYKTEYTHIVAFGGTVPIIALPIFKNWFKAAAILLLRGNDFDLGIFSPGKRGVLLDAIDAADRICILAEELFAKLSALTDGDKISLIPNGIDLNTWKTDETDIAFADQWKKENVESGRSVIGLIGQFKAKKGGVFLLTNVLAANLQNDFHFLLIGDVAPPMQEWLDQQGTALSISQLPFLDHFELLRYYPICDFVALPSFYDGMPNVLLEAGGLGIPVIAAKTGGISDVICHSKKLQPLSFHPGDRHACRSALWHASRADKETRIAAGEELKKTIEEHFDQNSETNGYINILNKTCKKPNIGFIKV